MISRLQNTLTKEYLGIIWFTEEPLEKRPNPFYHLDYFLDGLMSKFLSNGKITKNTNLIFSTSFAHPFFLANIQFSESDKKKSLSEIIGLVGNKNGPFNRILIIGNSAKELHSYMDSHFKKFTFDYFI